MSNPWADFDRRGAVHGQRGAGGGGVRRSGVPELPALLNLQHWYDFTDEDTVFSDEAGTIPSGDTDDIRFIVDKGTQPDDLIIADVDPTTPTYHLAQINGYAIGRGGSGSQMSVPMSNPSGAVGATIMMIGRHTNAGVHADFMRALDVPDSVIGIASDDIPQQWFMQVSAGGNISKAVVNNEWVWLFASHDGVTYLSDASGGMEEPTVIGYVDVDAGTTMNLFVGLGMEIAEFLMWDVGLDATEKEQAIARTDGKYGALPF